MPRVILTKTARFKDAAEKKKKKLMSICLGQKEMLGFTWEFIGEQMDIPGTTIRYRFNQGILTMDEWLQIFDILGVEKEDLEFLWTRES